MRRATLTPVADALHAWMCRGTEIGDNARGKRQVQSEEGPVKRIYVLAGPNGAGKTTFAREFLTHEANCPVFINADLIAEGLSPFAPERAALAAGRIMLRMIRESVERGDSFGFETTLAGRGYARSIPHWRRAAEEVIRRRFQAGLENFERLYKPIVTSWILYDNAGDELMIVDYGENP